MDRRKILEALLSGAQGASNAASDLVAQPVDAIAEGLRAVGVDVGNLPVGGTEWQKQKGLRATPQNTASGVIGETLGNAIPVVAAQKGSAIAQRALIDALRRQNSP